MTKRKADTRGGYVHPQPPYIDPKGGVYPSKQKGITLRDEFAKEAMAALIAKFPARIEDRDELAEFKLYVARGAYSYADAMLEARNA
jgi:hypothetical protein